MATSTVAVRRRNQQGGCHLLLSPPVANLAFTLGKVAGTAWKASMDGLQTGSNLFLLQAGHEWAYCSALRR